MKKLVDHVKGFSPHIGFMAFLYLNLLVGAVLAVCAIALAARYSHNFFHNPAVWDFIVRAKYLDF